MIEQLIYGSAAEGIVAGRSGYQVIACSPGIKGSLSHQLEKFCLYPFAEDSDPQTGPTYVAIQKFQKGSQAGFVLVRSIPGGSDYTGRSHFKSHLLWIPANAIQKLPSPFAILNHWKGWSTAGSAEHSLEIPALEAEEINANMRKPIAASRLPEILSNPELQKFLKTAAQQAIQFRYTPNHLPFLLQAFDNAAIQTGAHEVWWGLNFSSHPSNSAQQASLWQGYTVLPHAPTPKLPPSESFVDLTKGQWKKLLSAKRFSIPQAKEKDSSATPAPPQTGSPEGPKLRLPEDIAGGPKLNALPIFAATIVLISVAVLGLTLFTRFSETEAPKTAPTDVSLREEFEPPASLRVRPPPETDIKIEAPSEETAPPPQEELPEVEVLPEPPPPPTPPREAIPPVDPGFVWFGLWNQETLHWEHPKDFPELINFSGIESANEQSSLPEIFHPLLESEISTQAYREDGQISFFGQGFREWGVFQMKAGKEHSLEWRTEDSLENHPSEITAFVKKFDPHKSQLWIWLTAETIDSLSRGLNLNPQWLSESPTESWSLALENFFASLQIPEGWDWQLRIRQNLGPAHFTAVLRRGQNWQDLNFYSWIDGVIADTESKLHDQHSSLQKLQDAQSSWTKLEDSRLFRWGPELPESLSFLNSEATFFEEGSTHQWNPAFYVETMFRNLIPALTRMTSEGARRVLAPLDSESVRDAESFFAQLDVLYHLFGGIEGDVVFPNERNWRRIREELRDILNSQDEQTIWAEWFEVRNRFDQRSISAFNEDIADASSSVSQLLESLESLGQLKDSGKLQKPQWAEATLAIGLSIEENMKSLFYPLFIHNPQENQ